MKLYGMAAKPLQADGSLPLCEEIDLAVEYHIDSGHSEKQAIKETASEVRDIWRRTTKIQVSEDKSIIRKIDKIRAARKRTVMENSIDSRTNKQRFSNVKGHKKRANNRKLSKLTLADVKETLFDISSCKFKIPRPDQKFYEDQKGPRVLKGKVSNANHVSSPLVSKCGDTDTWNSEVEDEMEVTEETEKDQDFLTEETAGGSQQQAPRRSRGGGYCGRPAHQGDRHHGADGNNTAQRYRGHHRDWRRWELQSDASHVHRGRR